MLGYEEIAAQTRTYSNRWSSHVDVQRLRVRRCTTKPCAPSVSAKKPRRFVNTHGRSVSLKTSFWRRLENIQKYILHFWDAPAVQSHVLSPCMIQNFLYWSDQHGSIPHGSMGWYPPVGFNSLLCIGTLMAEHGRDDCGTRLTTMTAQRTPRSYEARDESW